MRNVLASIVIGLHLPLTVLALAAESPAMLVARMTNTKASWEERSTAEDGLAIMAPTAVLPALLPHIARGMPQGPIWNSAGREFDRQAPVVWQVFYAVSRSWSNQIGRLPREQGGDFLHGLLGKASTASAKNRILSDLTLRWTPDAESTVAHLLKQPDEDLTVRIAAGLTLILKGRENYHELFLAFAGKSDHADRKRWYDLLADPRHKRQTGVDPRVVGMGFDLLEAERQSSPDYVHGAYFLAVKTGDYVGQDFKPDQSDPRYQGNHGLTDEFFGDTVNNAMRWWNLNKDDIKKNLQPFAPADADKPRR